MLTCNLHICSNFIQSLRNDLTTAAWNILHTNKDICWFSDQDISVVQKKSTKNSSVLEVHVEPTHYSPSPTR